MRSFPPLKSTLRTLEVLILLNRSGTLPLRELHRATGLPKPTLVRILETLVFAGFVAKISSKDGYRVTSRITMLGTGIEGAPRIVRLAALQAELVTAKIRWPVSVATLDVDAMVVRYTTIPSSPLAPLYENFDRRLSLLDRAAGRVYLSFCPAAERQRLLRLLRHSTGAGKLLSSDHHTTQQIIRETRAAGFALCPSSVAPPTSTIAVPVWSGNNLLATLGATFLTRWASPEQAVQTCVPLLRESVREIQAGGN